MNLWNPFDRMKSKQEKNYLNIMYFKTLLNVCIQMFEYKNTPNKKQIGVIAQDYIGKDFSKYFLNQGIDQYYSVTYGNITNALIKYCQELNSKVENLTDMYNKQQEQIDKLNKEIEILRREK